MLASVRLNPKDLIAPLFVRDGEDLAREIPSMPGQYQYSPDRALDTARRWHDKGLPAVILFGVTDENKKDETGTGACDSDAPVQRLTADIKARIPGMVVITDTCLCEYTAHGHCGPIAETEYGKDVDNDTTLQLLARTAVSQAAAGADIVAPSAMMDGQVGAIRAALDEAGYHRRAIMSYAVKYASNMYGPFRDAAESPPGFGDRRSYQMDFRDRTQAGIEATADESEGADIIMIKPAATYLDVIAKVRNITSLPLAAYHVSGEYSQIMAAAQNGWVDEKGAAFEVTAAIKRAGADLVITYFAENLVDWLGS